MNANPLPWKSAADALSHLRSGMRVFVGSGCAAPQLLVEALATRASEVYDVEVLHILTHGPAPYAKRELSDHFRQNSFFIGGNVRPAVHEGVADYTPLFLSEIPCMFREGRMHLDIAIARDEGFVQIFQFDQRLSGCDVQRPERYLVHHQPPKSTGPRPRPAWQPR